MPTTIDQFFAVVELCRNLSTMQNNMRTAVQIWQAGPSNPRSEMFNNFPLTQQRIREGGQSFLKRLDANKAIVDEFPGQVAAGAGAIGVSITDMANVSQLLRTWATNLSTATVTNQTDLDNGTNALLAAVPRAMIPF